MRKIAAIILGALLLGLVAACGAGARADTAPTSTPIPTPNLPIDATALPAVSGPPSEPTAPGPKPGLPCPVQSEVCALAAQIENLMRAGDASGLVAISQPRGYQCPDPNNPSAAADLKTICPGAAAGEIRPGYLAGQSGQNNVVTQQQYGATIAAYFQLTGAALTDQHDVYGGGQAMVGSIACNKLAGGGCDFSHVVVINVTLITKGPDGKPARTTFFIGSLKDQTSGLLKPYWVSQMVPPNTQLTAWEGPAVFQDGSKGTFAFYPWTP
ncbi:MAG TPA: hypothetical protein VFY10_12250 [Dehalococcoidia bacterium]|nr:hypothetical protein [Dehalococcoidia bacterium]